MKLPDDLAKVFVRLFDHYLALDKEHGAQVKSGQSSTEFACESRAKMGRHEPFQIREALGKDDRGHERWGRVLWEDDGIRNGLIEVGHGDEFPQEPKTFRVRDTPQLSRPNLVELALRELPPDVVRHLELLGRFPLPMPLIPFGKPFKWDLGAEHRFLAPTLGVQQEPSRGPGNLALHTETALRLWGDRAAVELYAIGELIHPPTEVGRKTQKRSSATDAQRALARVIEAEANKLALGELYRLSAAMKHTPRLSTTVRRAGNG